MLAEIHEYLLQVTPERPAVLQEMEAYAKKHQFPIIGPLTGRLLYQLARMINAERILELGSGYGYSAFWFALATGDKGRIILTDHDESNKRLALQFFEQGGLSAQFDFRIGDALEVLRQEEGPFDIILNDVEKEEYPRLIDDVAERLRPGGLFITDNLLWSGRVMQDNKDAETAAIVEFTRRLYQDERFFTTIVPLRDGISISLRL